MSDDIENARKLFAAECRFIAGAATPEQFPPDSTPEVAFAGRSNAGKSSLINTLTGRNSLARISRHPGRTAQINFFDLGGKIALVDLPGYGYAKASKSARGEWNRTARAYLVGRARLMRVFVLMDSRRGVTDADRTIMGLFDAAAVSWAAVLTKTDALAKDPAALDGVIAATALEAKTHTAAWNGVFATSSRERTGIEELRAHIAALAAG